MSDDFTPDVDAPPLSPGMSLRDRLRAERQKRADAPKTKILIVPAWPTVGIRYKTIQPEKFEELAAGLKKKSTALETSLRIITECTDCIVVRESEEADWEVLTDDDGSTFGCTPALAEYLGFAAATSGETILGLFQTDHFPLAPSSHANALAAWMDAREDEIDEALLGE